MKVYYEVCSLRDFQWWAGAKDIVNDLTDEEWDYVESYLECFEEVDETQLNDWMWFDVPQLLEEARNEGLIE